MKAATRERRDRDDREADLPRPLERGLQAAQPSLQVAMHVLDHDDRVVDHEADRYGERHQRQVVEVKPASHMTATVPASDSGTVMPAASVGTRA